MARLDPHSYTDSEHPRVDSLRWRARVRFDAHRLDAEATLVLAEPPAAAATLALDTRDLEIVEVSGEGGAELEFALGARDPILGQELRIELPTGTRSVRISYRTAAEASALQWLTPAQTAAGTAPFLFSQCQAIHARSVIPCQDTPTARIRFHAELTVPKGMRGLMAAAHVSTRARGEEVVEAWQMPQPIPPYLFAFAVGVLEHRDLGPRSRVWAEPPVVEEAAWEFADVEKLIAAGEALFGPYDWDRFDLLVMPRSFPYGGMENPRLTFVTPTLLAGDRSQVAVIAHELAHSWTGNLITNANAEHFWLNEGWTRYAELRILEAVYGADVAALHLAVARRELDEAVARFVKEGRPELTSLRTHLEGIDPDDAYSVVPYEKGLFFLRGLEREVGRERWDALVRAYIERFRFGALTTEAFVAFLDGELPGVLGKIGAPAWIDEAGVPANAETPRSGRQDAIARLGNSAPDDATATGWVPLEWQLYLEGIRPATRELCEALDTRFGLCGVRNHEILVAWLRTAIEAGYAPAIVRAEALLAEVGRMKYLRPIYDALLARKDGRAAAQRAFEVAAPGYHPIARQAIGALLSRAH